MGIGLTDLHPQGAELPAAPMLSSDIYYSIPREAVPHGLFPISHG